VLTNRVKFAVGGAFLELINPWLPGHPHEQVAQRIGADDHRILEICAGTGYVARLIAAKWPDVEIDALDLSPESLALGRRRAASAGLSNVHYVDANAADMPFEDNAYDAVISCLGLHEIPTPERVKAIAETTRVLRAGGRLIAVDLDRPRRGTSLFDGYMRITEKPYARDALGAGLLDVITDAGFNVIEHRHAARLIEPYQLIEARLDSAKG
jgi:demethylmenaquinone methyltransferase/2-methoxy-6-polyprenyl-1,4-benzoquinol methylase